MDSPEAAQQAGQVTADAAVVYEDLFVPAIFGQWSIRVADALRLQPGQDVLDVACGTGALAREAIRRVLPGGSVTGVDRNPGMLRVAASKAPEIRWQEGSAEALPFAEASFDAVACQYGLMFFDDRVAALREMWRVLRPGGRLAVAVWTAIDQSPGWAAVEQLETRLLGADVAAALAAPFSLGDTRVLERLFQEAGIPDARVETSDGTVRFPSSSALVEAEIRGWTVSEQVSDEVFVQFRSEAERILAPFTESDGAVAFSMPAHLVTGTKT